MVKRANSLNRLFIYLSYHASRLYSSLCALFTQYSVYRTHVDIAVVLMYCAGAVLETLAEPLYNLYYSRMIMLPRLRAEMSAVTCRSLVTFAFVVWARAGILGFGAAQLVYGLVYCAVMVMNVHLYRLNGRELCLSDLMKVINVSSFVTSIRQEDGSMDPLLVLALHATGSSLLKHILTEGDKIVLSISASHFDQGIYAITSNYGSLVARIFFLPIEESCRVSFSRLSASGGQQLRDKIESFEIFGKEISKTDLSENVSFKSETRNQLNRQQAPSPAQYEHAAQRMVDDLRSVLTGIVLFSLVFPVIGSSYSRVAIKLFLGSKWYLEETVYSLGAFCFYILVLAVNGVSESFVHAVITPKSLYSFNVSLVACWVLFIGTSVPLMSYLGTSGLILANSVSMIARSSFNMYFIQRFYVHVCPNKSFRIMDCLLPPYQILVGCCAISIVCYFSSVKFASSAMRPLDALVHLGIGSICGIMYISLLWMFSKSTVLSVFNAVRRRDFKERVE